MSFWDIVIITASSERQAALYRSEIDRRRTASMLPEETQFLVVPDPADRPIGSGSATINALGALNKNRGNWPITLMSAVVLYLTALQRKACVFALAAKQSMTVFSLARPAISSKFTVVDRKLDRSKIDWENWN